MGWGPGSVWPHWQAKYRQPARVYGSICQASAAKKFAVTVQPRTYSQRATLLQLPMPSPVIATLDFEASSLEEDGFPIEVACVIGTPHNVTAQLSAVIRPRSQWDLHRGWSTVSQGIHGIDAADLKHGLPADQVCELLSAMLGGLSVAVDGGTFDSFWLQRLYEGQGPNFTLDHLSGLDGPAFRELKQQAQPRHRALPDALWLFDTISTLGASSEDPK